MSLGSRRAYRCRLAESLAAIRKLSNKSNYSSRLQPPRGPFWRPGRAIRSAPRPRDPYEFRGASTFKVGKQTKAHKRRSTPPDPTEWVCAAAARAEEEPGDRRFRL